MFGMANWPGCIHTLPSMLTSNAPGAVVDAPKKACRIRANEMFWQPDSAIHPKLLTVPAICRTVVKRGVELVRTKWID